MRGRGRGSCLIKNNIGGGLGKVKMVVSRRKGNSDRAIQELGRVTHSNVCHQGIEHQQRVLGNGVHDQRE